MTIKQLHEITTRLIAKDLEDTEVMVDTRTFPESDNGTVFIVSEVKIKSVQGADDSGPTGDEYPMLVISGEVEWHEHGSTPAKAQQAAMVSLLEKGRQYEAYKSDDPTSKVQLIKDARPEAGDFPIWAYDYMWSKVLVPGHLLSQHVYWARDSLTPPPSPNAPTEVPQEAAGESKADPTSLLTSSERLHEAIAVFLKDWKDGDFDLPRLAQIHVENIRTKYREVGKALVHGEVAYQKFMASMPSTDDGPGEEDGAWAEGWKKRSPAPATDEAIAREFAEKIGALEYKGMSRFATVEDANADFVSRVAPLVMVAISRARISTPSPSQDTEPRHHFAHFVGETEERKACWTVQNGPGFIAEFHNYKKEINHDTASKWAHKVAELLNADAARNSPSSHRREE